MATDVDIELINLTGYKFGAYSQSGISTSSIKLNVKPEFIEKPKNYQNVVRGRVVGPREGSLDVSGDMVVTTPVGIGVANFITAFVPDFSTSFFSLTGGWYLTDASIDFEMSKLASLDCKFDCNKNVS